MKTYLYWSGGKDSTASIILCYEKGIPLDGIVMSEVMFDHSRNISGEHPKHIDWVYNVAIPIIENVFGYKVIILKDNMDYVQLYNKKLTRSKKEERNGKLKGWFIAGRCDGNSQLKMRPIKKFNKSIKEDFQQIVGIAYDEPKRLEKLKGTNKISVLAEYRINESMTYDICKKYNLLSPMYEEQSRGGCWFCPNNKIKYFAQLKKEYPNLWDELVKLNENKNTVSRYFNYQYTFEQVEWKIELLNSQVSIFDLLEEEKD